MLSKDSFLVGFIPALIAPFLGSLIFYFIFFNYMELNYFIKHIVTTDKWVSVLSLGVIINLGLFFLFYRKQWDRSARGVLAATFIYAFVVVYFRVF
ncbi:MAG: hypothetical protein ABIS37_10625 [Bacteroidia bacterium]